MSTSWESGSLFVCPACGQRYAGGGYCPTDGSALAESDDPLLGSEIGRYRLARLLGEGGMGRVYLGVHPAIGSRVAIKVLSDQCARNPELLERFFAEARAVNLIRHESIVSVLDLAQLPDGRPYIVMEFIAGQTLAAIVQTGPAPLGGLVHVMTEVLSALAAAHAIGIVHRDLKPDNILVTAEGHAKVLDFGIAKLAPELQQQLSPRTRTGALLGTPHYMAPEQISGASGVDARADLYAVGVVVYEMATGKKPFDGETLFDLMRAHLEEPPPPPRALRPELPVAFEQVILMALAKRPDARFPDATAMAQALQHAAVELPAAQWRSLSSRALANGGSGMPSQVPLSYRQTQQDPPRTDVVTTARSAKRSGVVIGATVATLVAAGAAAWVIGARDPVPSPVSAPAAVPPTAVSPPSAPAAVPPAAAPSPVAPSPPVVEPSPPPARDVAAVAPAPPTAKPTRRPNPPKPAPSVAAGGAAHGVTIGPGVTIGGSSPSVPGPARTSLSRPADYNARRFDPVAYLPKAQAFARELIPDARLTSFEFDPVFPDGHVDLTLDGRDRSYEFRSPEASAFPAGRPKNMPIDRPCRVSVEVGVRELSARVLMSDSCDARFVRAPRCSLASVWKQALGKGVSSDVVSRIAWLSDERWFFDTDLAGNGGGVETFADVCP